MKITYEMLQAREACQGQVKIFKRLFPEGVEITEQLCVEHAGTFNWDWAAEKLLNAPARAEYERIRAPAQDEYDRVRASALAECERACAPARAEYDRIHASAWAEYERARASAWAEYERACAGAFGRLAS